MSTPAHNNDERFRQGLEDYREMPSPRVWAGVEAALDQDRKKRRFLFWLWFGTGGGALAAMLLLVFVLMGEPGPGGNPLVRGAYRVAQPGTTRHMARHQPLLSGGAGTHPDGNAASAPDHTSTVSATPRTDVRTDKPSAATQARPVNTQGTTANHSTTAAARDVFGVTGTSPAVHNPVPHRVETASAGSLLTLPTLPAHGAEPIPNPYEPRMQQPVTRIPDGVSAAMVGLGGGPLLQPTLGVQGYSGAVAYRRGQPVSGETANKYMLQSTGEQAGKQKKFGVYSGAVIKAGLVIKRHWYVNVGIGYENHSFADRYNFLVPGAVYAGADTNSWLGNGPPPIPSQLAGGTSGFSTNTAFGNADIPFPPGPPMDVSSGAPEYVQLNGKLVYRLHQLILPVDFGYRHSFKRLGVYVGGSAAFHVPLAQKALFYSDSGPVREVQLAPLARFNFSLGVEPGLEYNFTKRLSLLAGGTFRYQLLNAYQSGQSARPYVLGGHLGIRVSL